MTITAPSFLMNSSVRAQSWNPFSDGRLSVKGKLPSLGGATGWLNSPALTTTNLQGKVVLINIWTYTCINWLRQFPYVRAWSDKYRDQGLVVIGVHSPEFEFEKNIDNVRRAVADMKINFAVAVDSDLAIWRALNNNSWPALYFVDAQGRIRHQHVGEGDYGQSENVIQKLLTEGGARNIDRKLVSVNAPGVEAPADWDNLRSPETYVGSARTDRFLTSGDASLSKRRVYAAVPQLRLNHWSLSGDWTPGKEFATLNVPGGRISYQFHARDLHLVMGPAMRGASVKFRVFVDGKPPGADHGSDVDAQGNGVVGEQRLFQLIRQKSAIRVRRFEVEFLNSGVEAFAFTFG